MNNNYDIKLMLSTFAEENNFTSEKKTERKINKSERFFWGKN